MSWLFVAKVLPPLRVGDPPNYRSVLSNDRANSAVCWSIHLNDAPVGWAASKVVRREDGVQELHSYVFLEDLPLERMAPGWLGAFMRPVLNRTRHLDMSAKSRMEIDPLNRLVGFDSRVRLADIPDAIRMRGVVDGGRLKLTVQSGEIVWKTERSVPENALVGDELSPMAQLPDLKIGQTWTMPVYSPFRPPNSPMEILQASVERQEPIMWNGRSVVTHLVVYRGDSGSGFLSSQEPRGKLWVRAFGREGQPGMVLKQEARILNSTIRFVRLSKDPANAITAELPKDWSIDMPVPQAKEVLQRLKQPARYAH